MKPLDSQDVVLVVDDSADALSLINDTLEEAGISVLVALEGQQAISIARRMNPDMILLDAVMPRMDGFETCQRLKQDPQLNSIPVIFMTGLTETENVVRGLEVGGVDYLTKPIRPDELLARIRVHLQNARLTNSAHRALDSTGQRLITVDQYGQILWATPQATELIHTAEIEASQLRERLASALTTWLRQDPEPEHRMTLDELQKPFTVVFVEARNRQEFLLRLTVDASHSEEQLLQKKLNLTTREAEVLAWIARGKTNRDIGHILGISPRTVNKHLEQVYHKINVENRTSAARVAIQTLARNN